jgi:hypothetical protein
MGDVEPLGKPEVAPRNHIISRKSAANSKPQMNNGLSMSSAATF